MNQLFRLSVLFLLLVQFKICFPAGIPDSLYVQTQSNDKRVAIRALRALVFLQVDSLEDISMKNARKASRLAHELNDNKLIASTDFSLALCYEQMNRTDSALYYYEKALKQFRHLDEKKDIIDCLNNMSVFYKRQGDYPKALDLQLEALPLRQQLGDKRLICQAYNNLGNLYLSIQDSSKAIDSYHKGTELAEKSKDTLAAIYLGLNLGRLYTAQEQYGKAESILEKVMAFSKEQKMFVGEITVLNLLSHIELQRMNDQESFELVTKALQLSKRHQYTVGMIDAYNILGDYYKQKKQYRQSLDYYLEALGIINKKDFKQNRYELHRNISEIYELMRLPAEALAHYKEYIILKDSIYNQENDSKLASIQYKHELESKEKEKTLLEEKYKKQQLRQAFILLLVLLLVLIIILFSILLWKHRQAKKYLQELNEQKDRMFSLISHDLKGPIGTIKALFELLQPEELSRKEMETIMNEAKNAIDNSYNLLENLLYWARSQTGRMSINPCPLPVIPMVNQCLKLFAPAIENKNISINNKVDPEHQVYADKEMIEAVIRNLISNAIKFSYRNGEISIESKKEDHHLRIVVSDSGTGMTPDTVRMIMKNKLTTSRDGTFSERGSGIGLRICRDFIYRNKGRLIIDSENGKGTQVSVILPLEPGKTA